MVPEALRICVPTQNKARQHPTGRHWVDNLLRPTLLVHQFLRSEREGSWHLQQKSGANAPLFLHRWSYPLCQIYHLAPTRDEGLLPEAVKHDLEAGAHVCQHSQGH